MINFENLKTAMGNLDEDMVKSLLEELVKSGGEGAEKALVACQEGMDIIGKKYEGGDYFVADLIYAGDLMSEAAGVLKPFLMGEAGAKIGKMILCTVKGDIHDIGKNIVKALLEAGGIEVIDLGVDVPSETIVNAAKENGITVVGLSAVLTLGIDSMKTTVEALAESGLRDKVKVIIGGAPVTEDYSKFVGADAWSLSAAESVNICHKWLAG